ncbi:hypothetical protein [Oceaniovalibus sp. ACAM 378]|uniref:hypothetical protein n=1 Tax=Oceaniovalibus sp. ACAM 378 TaxID=2599923 RepID=UPI0011D5A86D|nr:hypothetical protein [Oceaniovalibus sp. ACAM 378]TYB85519.1 hypothetical protein FQ320_18545 [Oceaniovalibus sp. ACAM 378]
MALKLKWLAASCVVMNFCGTVAFAQAFGIEMGTSISNLEVKSEIGNGKFEVVAPVTHSEFESYLVNSADSTGVCMVTGIGGRYGNDSYGLNVLASFDKLDAALSKKYGKYEDLDFIRNGALWRDSDEWVMAIRQNERVKQSVWSNETGSTLPDDITEILLTIRAMSHDTAWIHIQYRFANSSACEAALSKAGDDAL